MVDNIGGDRAILQDVPARWVAAAGARPSLQTTPVNEGSATRRRSKNSEGKNIHVMFTSEHVRELEPAEWMERPLGSGSYGLVYKAAWRGQDVAVKVLKLPERAQSPSSAANAKLQAKVAEIVKDFVTEVEICADLNHPNLVRLLGYADKPQLMIVQELCEGNSLDQQMYVEGWRPSHGQMLKIAHDVASGMEHLHTAYNAPDNVHTQPIIHR